MTTKYNDCHLYVGINLQCYYFNSNADLVPPFWACTFSDADMQRIEF